MRIVFQHTNTSEQLDVKESDDGKSLRFDSSSGEYSGAKLERGEVARLSRSLNRWLRETR